MTDHPWTNGRKALRAARRLLSSDARFWDEQQTIDDAPKASKAPGFSRGHQVRSGKPPGISIPATEGSNPSAAFN